MTRDTLAVSSEELSRYREMLSNIARNEPVFYFTFSEIPQLFGIYASRKMPFTPAQRMWIAMRGIPKDAYAPPCASLDELLVHADEQLRAYIFAPDAEERFLVAARIVGTTQSIIKALKQAERPVLITCDVCEGVGCAPIGRLDEIGWQGDFFMESVCPNCMVLA